VLPARAKPPTPQVTFVIARSAVDAFAALDWERARRRRGWLRRLLSR
jgi:hypothetical protein